MIEIFILSLIQGIAEFLPISSSSHLIIISEFINFQQQDLIIDVSLHIGSFIAVIVYFQKDLLSFFRNKKLFLKIIIASLPVMLIGFLLVHTGLIEKIRNIKVIGWTTLIFGVLLFVSDQFKLDNHLYKNLNYRTAIIIGLFQVLSLIPGVSRSGITITAARFLNFNRVDSAKISFLLSIPTLGAVSIFGIMSLLSSENADFSSLSLFCILLSFTFSYITIKFFLKFLRRFDLKVFVIYRVLLGIGILLLA